MLEYRGNKGTFPLRFRPCMGTVLAFKIPFLNANRFPEAMPGCGNEVHLMESLI